MALITEGASPNSSKDQRTVTTGLMVKMMVWMLIGIRRNER